MQVIDHHVPPTAPASWQLHVEPVGATVTLLVAISCCTAPPSAIAQERTQADAATAENVAGPPELIFYDGFEYEVKRDEPGRAGASD